MSERCFSPGEDYQLDLEFIIGKIVICNLRKWFGFYLCKHSCSSAYYNLIKDMMNGRYQILICVNPFSILYTIPPFSQITHTRSFVRSFNLLVHSIFPIFLCQKVICGHAFTFHALSFVRHSISNFTKLPNV